MTTAGQPDFRSTVLALSVEMGESTRILHKRTIVAGPFTIPVAETGSGESVFMYVNGMQ